MSISSIICYDDSFPAHFTNFFGKIVTELPTAGLKHPLLHRLLRLKANPEGLQLVPEFLYGPSAQSFPVIEDLPLKKSLFSGQVCIYTPFHSSSWIKGLIKTTVLLNMTCIKRRFLSVFGALTIGSHSRTLLPTSVDHIFVMFYIYFFLW